MSSFIPRGRPIVIPSNVGPILEVQIPLPSFDGAIDAVRHMNMFLNSCLANNIKNAYHLMMLFPTTLCGDAFEWYYSLEAGSIRNWSLLVKQFVDHFTVDNHPELILNKLLNYKQQHRESIQAFMTRF